MIIRCQKCNSALKYDVALEKMICLYCGTTYDVDFAKKEYEMEEIENINCQYEDVSDNNLYNDESYNNTYNENSYNEMSNDNSYNITSGNIYNNIQNGMNMGTFSKEQPNEYADSYEEDSTDDMNRTYVNYNIYRCSACGAELAVNDVESATYCAYCGQPSIVWERISEQRQPDYIIPFKITKQQALEKIRKRFKKGIFIPKRIKNFKVDILRGVYVPFYVYKVSVFSDVYLSGVQGSSKNARTYYFRRCAEANLENVTVDASTRLNSESIQRLEPFNIDEKLPFSPDFLSGFYADCNDEAEKEMEKKMLNKTIEVFHDKVKSTVNAREIKILESNPRWNVMDVKYMLLPVWFLSFEDKEKTYTILMNGQTGKIVGGVPYIKSMAAILKIGLGIVFSYYLNMIVWGWYEGVKDRYHIRFIIGLLFVIVFTIALAGGLKISIKEAQELSNAKSAEEFVSTRQGGDE